MLSAAGVIGPLRVKSTKKTFSSDKIVVCVMNLYKLTVIKGISTITYKKHQIWEHEIITTKADHKNRCMKPAFAAMHGLHSLIRFGPGCADHA